MPPANGTVLHDASESVLNLLFLRTLKVSMPSGRRMSGLHTGGGRRINCHCVISMLWFACMLGACVELEGLYSFHGTAVGTPPDAAGRVLHTAILAVYTPDGAGIQPQGRCIPAITGVYKRRWLSCGRCCMFDAPLTVVCRPRQIAYLYAMK